MTTLMAFLPELVLLGGALGLFAVTLGENGGATARRVALATAALMLVAAVACLFQQAVLFDGAYRVDAFSQWLKVVIAAGFLGVTALQRDLPDIRREIRPEYYLFLTLSLTGLTMLVSAIDVIALMIALELSSFPLYLMVAMRREREGRRVQMESAIKYIMFGIAANGMMFFGLSYLYGLTGSLSLPVMLEKLPALMGSPLAIVGLGMTFAGLFYKLAVFPFHFWTPDVYQGASNETAGFIASLPKLGAVAVMARFVQLADGAATMALLFSVLAAASMFYGNLIALGQKDLKRLLGFSGIAHAGYAMVGFVALDRIGSAAALFYIMGYVIMVLACFVVITLVSRDGENVAIAELAGLHKRSPLLAVTLGTGLFALAGLPPFVGFMGKLGLLTAALNKGHLAIVVIAVINSAIAVYYYLSVIRVAVFGDKADEASAPPTPIVLGWTARLLCVGLIAGIVIFGVAPARVLAAIAASL